MKKTYLLIIALLAVFGIGIYAFGYSGPAPKVVVEGNYIEATDGEGVLGAVASPDVYNRMFFHDGFSYGGRVYNASSTLTANVTLTAAEVCTNAIISVNDGATAISTAGVPSEAGYTVTMPATSTLFAYCMPNDGDSISFLFINESPTAATTTVLTEGDGMEDYLIPGAGDATIAGQGDAAQVTIIRKDNWKADGTKDAIMRIDEIAP